MKRRFKRKKRPTPSPEKSVGSPESAGGSFAEEMMEPSSEQPQTAKSEYPEELIESVNCIRFMLSQGFPPCSLLREAERRDGDITSFSKLIQLFVSPDGFLPLCAAQCLPADANIQEDLFRAAAKETIRAIVEELGDDVFSVHLAGFVDSEGDPLLAVFLRLVDKRGFVKERFIGTVNMEVISGSILKAAFDSLLTEHGIVPSRIRGLSYDSSDIICPKFGELIDLIIGENRWAYMTHCRSNQLHSYLVSIARRYVDVSCFGKAVSDLIDVVGARCEKKDGLEKNEKKTAEILQVLTNDDLSAEELHEFSARVQNMGLGFNYEILPKFIPILFTVIEVLCFIEDNAASADYRYRAHALLDSVDSFRFVFCLHLMRSLFGITYELSRALELEGDPDFGNVLTLANICKQQLQKMKDEGWEDLIDEVVLFCKKYDIAVPQMDENVFKSKIFQQTNFQLYHDEQFYGGIDSQIIELNNIFSDTITELLICAACFNPSNSFCAFDKEKLVELAQCYPNEFSDADCLSLRSQLETFIDDVRSDQRFSELNSLGELSSTLVETRKHLIYFLVHRLIKLVLLLPIIRPAEERTVSAMELIKTKVSDQICDPFMNDCLVTYIERDVLDGITNDAILNLYECLKNRRLVV